MITHILLRQLYKVGLEEGGAKRRKAIIYRTYIYGALLALAIASCVSADYEQLLIVAGISLLILIIDLFGRKVLLAIKNKSKSTKEPTL